jgi:hypothetical protein
MWEIQSGETLAEGRVRRAGGGRRALIEVDPTLVDDLEALVGDEARGDPESPLRWTAKSVRTLAGALRERGHRVSHETVAKLLRSPGYSLQANRKMIEGASHPDRDAQFAHINTTAAAAIDAGQPVTSVATETTAFRTAMREASRSTSHQRSPSTSPRRIPVIAASRQAASRRVPLTDLRNAASSAGSQH